MMLILDCGLRIADCGFRIAEYCDTKEYEINKVSFFLNPKREKTKIFCKKIFVFSLKRPRQRGLFREKKNFFLQKKFFFSLFGFLKK
jgi:hypothetical protein